LREAGVFGNRQEKVPGRGVVCTTSAETDVATVEVVGTEVDVVVGAGMVPGPVVEVPGV
jgi:hypothetical protein